MLLFQFLILEFCRNAYAASTIHGSSREYRWMIMNKMMMMMMYGDNVYMYISKSLVITQLPILFHSF